MRSVSQSASVGLEMASARLARSAHEVANANTAEQASRGAPTTQEAVRLYLSGELPKPVLQVPQPDPTQRDTDIAKETIQQVSAVAAFKANLEMLKTDDDLTQRILEVKI